MTAKTFTYSYLVLPEVLTNGAPVPSLDATPKLVHLYEHQHRRYMSLLFDAGSYFAHNEMELGY
jgi:hypothetical protein